MFKNLLNLIIMLEIKKNKNNNIVKKMKISFIGN